MKKLFRVSIALCVVISLHAQTEDLYGSAGHFRFGYANHNLSGMNAWLPDYYPSLKNDFVTVGGTGYILRNRVVLGGEGFGSIGTTVVRDTLSLAPSMGRGMLNVGYVILDHNDFVFYPLVGFGGGGTTIRVSENQGFGAIVNRLKETDYTFSNSNLMLSISLGADTYFISEAKKHGFSMGLRAGYIYCLQNSNWKKNSTDIAGPNMNTSGFYFTIGIGGGRLHRK
ncbi:MAG: hypothetical protein JNL60_05265 [Bacteroidia bacterium]|nr:hypothetical protein [Bacteroidia bacterium]